MPNRSPRPCGQTWPGPSQISSSFRDHRCPPNVKPEYYLYYLDLKEEMFGIKT